MNYMSSPVTVYVPKQIFAPAGERNKQLQDLFSAAGYTDIRDKGPTSRSDEVIQNGIRFKGLKSANNLSYRLQRTESDAGAGIVIGSDVLMEAWYLYQARCVVRKEIQRVMQLGLRSCAMRFLVPNPDFVPKPSSLNNRTIFTKFPLTLSRCLVAYGISKSTIVEMESADVALNDFRNEFSAALDIVETGNSARALNLSVLEDFPYPTPKDLGVSFADFPEVNTDFCIVNASRMQNETRESLLRLGERLASVLVTKKYTVFTYLLRTKGVPDGSRKPSTCFSRKGSKNDIPVLKKQNPDNDVFELCVEESQSDTTRMLLLGDGAQILKEKVSTRSSIIPTSKK